MNISRKRPFVLLEVLIALTLAMLCAIPLLTKPIRLYRSELKFIEEAERERIAEQTFVEIKAQLLLHPDLKKLPVLYETKGPIQMPPVTLDIPKQKEVKRSYTIYCKGDKGSTRLFYIKIHLTPDLWDKKRTYDYRLYL